MKIIFLIIASIVAVGMALGTTHFWGLGQTHFAYSNDFFASKQSPRIMIPWEQAQDLAGNPEWIVWVDVIRDDSGNIIARSSKVAPSVADKQTPDSESHSIDSSVLLADIFERTPARYWVLNIVSNVEGIHEQISEIIGDKPSAKFLIQSEFPAVLEAVKSLRPHFVYGLSQPDRARLKVFDALWILPATPIKADVYVGPLKWNSVQVFTKEIAAEMNRRKKKIFIGPLDSKEQVNLALSLGSYAIYVLDPQLVSELQFKNE